MIVRKPARKGPKWIVVISETLSPLSPVIETIECNGEKEAWKAYWGVMKELGHRY